ncbi:hypothetical protein [Corynebacterium occultum]|uniref:hypothetical protein n=1 Tax=Corynebacterium occultum TaxID=2675219 RepID=UPI001E2E6972|nr:hypothetical protein [Corynebacterium occultum]
MARGLLIAELMELFQKFSRPGAALQIIEGIPFGFPFDPSCLTPFTWPDPQLITLSMKKETDIFPASLFLWNGRQHLIECSTPARPPGMPVCRLPDMQVSPVHKIKNRGGFMGAGDIRAGAVTVELPIIFHVHTGLHHPVLSRYLPHIEVKDHGTVQMRATTEKHRLMAE